MTSFNSRLLTPPREEEEIYPYRRVWRSVIIEMGALFAVALGVFVLLNILRVQVPAAVERPLEMALPFIPVGLWFVFSLRAESAVLEPRTRLLGVFAVSALVANAVTLPLIQDFIRADEWLSLASAFDRIIGYTFTSGILHALLKYLILRYMLWEDFFRTRLDVVAYAATCAIGYSLVLNLQLVLTEFPPLDVTAIRVFSTTALHVTTAIVIAYGLAESRFSNATPLLLPLAMAISAAVSGAAIPLRAGLTNASISLFSLELTAPRPLFGLLFSAGITVGVLFAVGFFIENSERLQREATEARERV